MKILVGKHRQVTIPKILCDRLGIKAGSALDFQEIKGTLIITKLAPGDDPIQRMYGCLGTGRSTDRLLAELRDKF